MKISNELLAAYAEGKVSDAEKESVRQYLMEHPDELESVMVIMDKDYELEPDEKEIVNMKSHGSSNCIPFYDIALSAAAFAPQKQDTRICSTYLSNNEIIQNVFIAELDTLIDDLEIL